jgi:S-adenosylmethionine:diacylglycerol 3-amino-3-carboxypropyl transferase
LHSFDISKAQINLTRLRVATAKHLDYDDYLGFWGYTSGGSQVDSDEILDTIGLPPDLRAFAVELVARSVREKRGLIYLGRWERTIRTLSRVLRTLLGERVMTRIIAGDSLTKAEEMGGLRDQMRIASAVRVLGNSNFFRSILYGAEFPSLNLAPNDVEFYRQLLDKSFEAAPIDRNFFLQMIFFGRITAPEALPDDAQAAVYLKAQSILRSGVDCQFKISSILDLRSVFKARQYDLVCLSDIPSYLSAAQMNAVIGDLESLVAPGGRVFMRCYRHRPDCHPSPSWTETAIPQAHTRAEKTGAYSYAQLRFHRQTIQGHYTHTGGSIHECAI